MNKLRQLQTAQEIQKRKSDFFKGKFTKRGKSLDGNRGRDLLNTLFNPYPIYNNDGTVREYITTSQYFKRYNRKELRRRLSSLQRLHVNMSDVSPRNDLLWFTSISQSFNKRIERIITQPILDEILNKCNKNEIHN